MRTLIASSAVVATLVFAAPPITVAQDAPFCLQSGGSGLVNCIYQTMAQCEQAKPYGATDAQCVSRSQIPGTTGSGGAMTVPTSPQQPGSPPPAGSAPVDR